ncbi:type II secretion system F family protein [Salinimicrobium sp. MT39]|uniref:General secretion pathway protein F n=1 Tax=Salinimicrobium profundisediminis TaxID=2994553 RepID=A0A9X3CZ68_9FLAO|nr:type II secretion system F family protein [Salinimicrobium profundisediminis]MCX2839443.1 type II secretion system F family protein [Salinimicrobium profundisediminis]
MGIKIEQVQPRKKSESTASLDSLLKKEINFFGKTFSDKKKEQFYSELSVLLKSGVNLKMALDLIEESQKENDKKIISKLNEEILRGSSFAAAMEKDKNFTPYEYRAIKIGEQTGQLTFVTNDLAEYYQRKNEQKRQVMSSLTYPIIVLFTAFIVVFFMLKYVVPMFEDIFEQNRVELPFLTQVIVKASHLLEVNGMYIFFGVAALIVGLRASRKKEWFRKYSGQISLKLPIIGEYVRKIYITRFTHTMMLLTNSKIPVVNGLAMVREMVNFHPLQESLRTIEADILQGQRMSESFKKHPLFDKKMIALLKVAEETNQTEYVFKKLYDQYSREVEYQSKTITNILNPILTLMVGFIVGLILIAMYLPMFRLSSVIG